MWVRKQSKTCGKCLTKASQKVCSCVFVCEMDSKIPHTISEFDEPNKIVTYNYNQNMENNWTSYRHQSAVEQVWRRYTWGDSCHREISSLWQTVYMITTNIREQCHKYFISYLWMLGLETLYVRRLMLPRNKLYLDFDKLRDTITEKDVAVKSVTTVKLL
jgi:hypothetical protein